MDGNSSNLTIFVTGATGFIGSHFVNAALSKGHSVTALRRLPDSEPSIPIVSPESGSGDDPKSPLRWVVKPMGEIGNGDLAGCDVLVHLAAHTPNVPYDTLENCLLWNLMKPIELFKKAAAAGVSRFVVAGSCFEYGRSGERYEFIPPDAPLEPTQTYPASKAAASIAFRQMAVDLKLELSIHRIFQVFGEGEAESRLWPSLRRCALAGEDLDMTPAEQIRDFIPVSGVAEQLLQACSASLNAGHPQIFNLGTGQPTTLRSFSEFWWRHWNATGKLKFGAKPYRAGEVMRYVPDIRRAILS